YVVDLEVGCGGSRRRDRVDVDERVARAESAVGRLACGNLELFEVSQILEPDPPCFVGGEHRSMTGDDVPQRTPLERVEQGLGRRDRPRERSGEQRIGDGREVVAGEQYALIDQDEAHSFSPVAGCVDRGDAKRATLELGAGADYSIGAHFSRPLDPPLRTA